MYRSLCVAAFLAVSLAASPLFAWHEVGHMLTILVAYKQLSPGDTPAETVTKLVVILKHHPRYQEDFANSMPKGLRRGRRGPLVALPGVGLAGPGPHRSRE